MDTSFARTWLRLEGAAVLVAALVGYHVGGFHWGAFALLFLVPDLSMLGYLASPKVGAWAYNLVHSYLAPLLLGTLAFLSGPGWLTGAALIWCAHIGFDRTLGYGLKSPEGFGFTHLGKIGRQR